MSGSMLFNLPNMLTLSRIVAIPLVVACFWLDRGWAQWLSMALFVAAAVTDWFDGYFARRYHQISRFGRFLDPIADKLLVAAALVMLVDNSTLTGVNVLAALIILAREILVSGLREFLAELRVGLPVSALAKWKTAVQMVAIAALLVGDSAAHWVTQAGIVLIWIAAALTLITGYDYLRTGLRHMAEDPHPRVGRSEDPLFRLDEAHRRRSRGRGDSTGRHRHGRRPHRLAAQPQPRPCRGAGRRRGLRRRRRPAHGDLRREARRRARSRLLSPVHRRMT